MSEAWVVREVSVSAFHGYGSEFFIQQRVDQSKTGFELEIPGEVVRAGGATLFGYKDAAVVVNDEGEGRRAAWIGSHVEDTRELVQAIYALGQEVGGAGAAGGFAVRLKTETPVGQLLDGLADPGGGCGCDGDDGGKGCVAVPGSVRVGFADSTGERMLWSAPVAATLLASWFPASSTTREGGDCVALGVGPNATACYGSKRITWNDLLPSVHTVCVGGCSSGDCCIRRTKAGTCVTTANGWHSCSCI